MEGFYAVFFVFTCLLNLHLGASTIGINYGLNGDNLPPPSDVVSLLKSRKIQTIRLFEPNPNVLTALQGSGISIILGTRNEDIQPFASDINASIAWIKTNVVPYTSSLTISHISVGNEVVPGQLSHYVPTALRNLDSALVSQGFNIPVTTTVSMVVLGVSFPLSKSVFSPDAGPIMRQITSFLESKHYPLLLNAYPYFPRVSDPANVNLDYALLQKTVSSPIMDESLTYSNLFDSMVDSVYGALEKVGGADVEIIVSETGWPSDGGVDASVANAQIYNNNLAKHVSSGKGTPRRPKGEIQTYIFALFNENLKPQGVEQHWGLYNPGLTEVYHVDFP